MKHQKNFRTYLLGVLTALLLVSLADPALAAAKKMIEVSTGVKIFVDGTRLYPTEKRPVGWFYAERLHRKSE